jgi:hypothetical protein
MWRRVLKLLQVVKQPYFNCHTWGGIGLHSWYFSDFDYAEFVDE